MKKILLLFMFAAGVLFTACDNDDEVSPGNLTSTVQLPEEYSSYDITNVTVNLINRVTDEVIKSGNVDAEGNVSFMEVVPGSYKVKAEVQDTYVSVGINRNGKFKLIGTNEDVLITSEQTTSISLELVASDNGGLVISELYYNYTKTIANKAYLEDPYLHIYNNSTEVINADGLYIGYLYNYASNASILEDQDHVYLGKVFKVPGAGTEHPIQPGEHIVIAQDGMNHQEDENGNPGRSVDLSNADFEFFVHDNGASKEDIDFASVPNLEQVYYMDKSFDIIPHNRHPKFVIFKLSADVAFDSFEIVDLNSKGTSQVVKVPAQYVIDGFEAREDADNTKKNLPNSIVSTVYGGIESSYKGWVVKRKVLKEEGGITFLQNTRNNNEDFEKVEIYAGSSN